MNINVGIETNFDIGKLYKKAAKEAVKRLGIEAQKHAMNTINTFENHKGNSQGVDSGAFRDTIKVTEINDGFGFRMSDSVPYGIYHERGTDPHWLPFFNKDGTMTELGKWAMKKFSNKKKSTFQVVGKRGKALKNPSRISREEQLKKMGGITVQLDEMAPFRKALAYAKSIETKIFKEEMKNVGK